MTNAVPPGSLGASSSAQYPDLSSSMPPRRSSYASVAAGTAAASPQNQISPSRSGAFSYLMNHTASLPAELPDSEPRPQIMPRVIDAAVQVSDRTNIPDTWGKGSGMQNYSNQYCFGGLYAAPNGVGSGLGGFFVPSYLRESKYMERLEAAHKAKLAAQKEATALNHTTTNNVPLSTHSSIVNLHRMAPSHRGMTHEIVEHQPVIEEDDVGPLPSRWADIDRNGGLEIVGDGLEVRYTGPLRTLDHEAAAARTDHPMPPQCGIYYYEVSIVSKGKEGMIGIGFSGSKVPLEKLPGWQPDSWAYHGDDGMTFCCESTGKKYGPTFTTNDIVGCGVNFMKGSAFFTKNGVLQGTAFKDLKDIKLFPSVGAKRPGAQLRVNFGQTPFLFDIDGMMAREKANIMSDINLVKISPLQPSLSEDALIKELVSQFLRHDGYVDTAKAFTEEMTAESDALKSGTDTTTDNYNIQEDLDAVNRQQIRAAILDGDIDKALKRTNAYYPTVLRENPRIYFRLRCRKFVEMMRQSTELLNGPSERRQPKHTNGDGYAVEDGFGQAMDLDDPMSNGADDWDRMETTEPEEVDNSIKYQEKLDETLRYAQELKFEFKDDTTREVKEMLQSIFALFAYEDPRTSPTAPVMDQSGRVPVAEELNSAILVSLGKSSVAALERLCQQTEVLISEISEQGGAAAFINIDHDFLR